MTTAAMDPTAATSETIKLTSAVPIASNRGLWGGRNRGAAAIATASLRCEGHPNDDQAGAGASPGLATGQADYRARK